MHNQEEILKMIASESDVDTHQCQCGRRFDATEDGCPDCGARGIASIMPELELDSQLLTSPTVEFIWEDWGVPPSTVPNAPEFVCRNCRHNFCEGGSPEWLSCIVGYSSLTPNHYTDTQKTGPGVTVQCPRCQSLSWFHATRVVLVDYLLLRFNKHWPRRPIV